MVALALLACGSTDPVELSETTDTGTPPTSDTQPPTTTPSTTTCVPSRDAFEANALPALERNCAVCHGDPTQFGAPFTVLDYDELVAGAAPDRKVDLLLAALLDGSMPPATAGILPHNDLDTLVGWASCGTIHPDPAEGLVSSREVWEAPPEPPVGAVPIELSAGEHFVDVDDIDDYEYFYFSNVVDDDVFIQRMEAFIDESAVVHHITLRHAIAFDYLYTWAPGTGAIQFPDGGIKLRPSETLLMEIHYNNGAGIPDVYDSSGIRLWVGDTTGTEYGMASPSVWNIDIPAESQGTASGTCRATMDFEIVAGMPHMHELGSTFEHVLERPDGAEISIVELTGWSFEAQYFYDMGGLQVRDGDTLRLTCTYDNPHPYDVHWGEGTSDEMCFDFIYVKPAAAAYQCFL